MSSTARSPKKNVKLLFNFPTAEQQEEQAQLEQMRPKAQGYADKIFPPPRGTRKSMGKR